MPVLQLNDQQFPLIAGTTRIGGGAGADVALPVDDAHGIQALIEPAADHTLVIRRASPDSVVRVNGVLLGAEPTPLMHGDKVEVIGLELRYADDAKGGATQFVSASEMAALAGSKRVGVARATAASGGRLVSLVDGKEYSVPSAGLMLGRDAACDVVLPLSDVSRRHAEIAPGEQGYVVRDTSANGVFVNGERVQGSHRLARADVIRVGTEEFRFYADVLPIAPTPVADAPAAAPLPPRVTAAPVAATLSPPAVAAIPPAPAPAPAAASADPARPVVDARPVLATLERLNAGPGNGEHLAIRTPLAHVGRGAHNDVQLAEESVSETHAKLQRRDDGWYVVDMESTNGTYVGGVRVTGERRLEGSPDVRFGGVKLRFTVAGAGSADDLAAHGTRAISAVDRARPSVAARPPVAGRADAPSRGGMPAWLWAVVALMIAAAAYVVLMERV